MKLNSRLRFLYWASAVAAITLKGLLPLALFRLG